MTDYLYTVVFERGPMPFVSIATSILAIVMLIAFRPRSFRSYLVTLSVCLLPVLAGVAGYFMGVHQVDIGFRDYLATNPSPEMIESMKESFDAGKLLARDPFILGVILSVPLVALGTVIYVLNRGKRLSEPAHGGEA